MSNRILYYKGLMTDGQQDTILLSTKKGEVGYRITRFDVITKNPMSGTTEAVVQVFSSVPDNIDATVDFSNTNFLGVAIQNDEEASLSTSIIIPKIFNQDIYITYKVQAGSDLCNYYLELEVIKLDEDQAMVATLSDIRTNS